MQNNNLICYGIILQGSLHTAKSIYIHEGIRAFFRGFLLNQMVWVSFNVTYLPLWEACKLACARFSGAESVEKLHVQYELGSAFICSSFAAGLTNPIVSACSQSVGISSYISSISRSSGILLCLLVSSSCMCIR